MLENIKLEKELDYYISNDKYPLPATQDREGYMDSRHYEFWLSGLQDYLEIKHLLKKNAKIIGNDFRAFDFGCASGRVLRHFLCHEKHIELWATDLNSRHVEWVRKFLGPSVKVFQNSKLPHLPIEDKFFDLVYAFSVFTHIDTFELFWLSEIRRVLKRGGFAYITIHSEHTWNAMKPGWPIYDALLTHPEITPDILKRPMEGERVVYRWYTRTSYAANVFHTIDYIRATWGRFFEIVDMIRQGHILQDVVLLKRE
jgi:SAM-dependent methyltransferase